MKSRILWLPFLALVAAVALLAGLSVGTVQAGPPQPVEAVGLTLDEATVTQLRDIAKRSEAFISRNPDGTLKLDVKDAQAIGASEKFLADYKAALEAINVEIRAGRLQENADGTLKVNVEAAAPTQGSARAAGLPAGAQLVENPTAEQIAAARPALQREGDTGGDSLDWSVGDRYNSLYVQWSSYDAYWYRYSPYYYTWPAAMAAHVGRPYISVRLVYLFSYHYNYHYFNYCTYNFGSYWYIPWQYLCNSCYSGYYPVYFYVRYIYIWYGHYYYYYQWKPYQMYF